MVPGDKGEIGELEAGFARGEEVPPAEEAQSKAHKPYRGDLNGAYQKWLAAGKPADESPLVKELFSEARLFADRSARKAWVSSSKISEEGLARIREANEDSIQRAIKLHDPNREGGGSFTTYLKRAVINNIRDELRRVEKPPHQKALLRAFGGNLETAHWWIDEDREEWNKKVTELVPLPVNIARKDRPLAHWFIDQDPNTKITWRHVLGAFPQYKTEDTAGRALKRVKKAIEKAPSYRL